MPSPATIGLDIAKNVFQAHGTDAAGSPILRKRLRRDQLLPFFASLSPCLIGIEACSSAHHWARELKALGHDVRLIPPIYVKPYLKRGKSDALDAEAICEAVARPTMRFVPVKTVEQQSALMLHRSRSLLIKHRTMIVNALRAHMAELGIIVPQGRGPLGGAGRASVDQRFLERHSRYRKDGRRGIRASTRCHRRAGRKHRG